MARPIEAALARLATRARPITIANPGRQLADANSLARKLMSPTVRSSWRCQARRAKDRSRYRALQFVPHFQ